jgi:hypothetical protein
MAECDYCGEGFDDEDALLDHMADEHEGELGRIDQRRVGDRGDDGGGVPTGPIALGLIIFVSAAVVAFVVFGGPGGDGGDAAEIPDPEQVPTGETHEHGTMEMVVLGEQVDFSQQKYQVGSTGNPNFHFENGDGRVWHAHANGVTVQYAMWTLDIGVTEDEVIYNGTTYRDAEGYNVSVTVNGESVDPTTYTLEGASEQDPEAGDHVRIVVEQTDGG